MDDDRIHASDLGPCPAELEGDPIPETVSCEWCGREIDLDQAITLKEWPNTSGDIFICLVCFDNAENEGMTCGYCHGEGQTKSGRECTACKGAGIRPKEKR